MGKHLHCECYHNIATAREENFVAKPRMFQSCLAHAHTLWTWAINKFVVWQGNRLHLQPPNGRAQPEAKNNVIYTKRGA